jgi:hypothetical protein
LFDEDGDDDIDRGGDEDGDDKTSRTTSRIVNTGRPSKRTDISKAIISASVVEWLTADCFLQKADTGAIVLGPANATKHPDVLFESRRSPAKSASENTHTFRSSGLSPTTESRHMSRV